METKNNNNQINQETTIDLLEIARTMWFYKWAIILTTIFGALIVMLGTKIFVTPKYTSTTSMYVLVKQAESKVTSNDLTAGKALTSDYVELAKSRPVLEQAIAVVGVSDMDADDLKKIISIETPTDTRVIKVSVTYKDPQIARELANAIREALATQIVSVMDIDAVNTVEEANVPTTQSSPNLKRNALIGAAVGFVLATIIVIIITMLDDTIKTPEDIENYLELTVLGSIPVEKGSEDSLSTKDKVVRRGRALKKRKK